MHDVLAVGDVVEVDQAGVQPLVVRVLGGELGLDLLVLDDPVLVGVDEEHPARLQPALADDGGGVEVEDADLGGEDDEAVVGDPVARGAQAVAVEHGADLGAVGEDHAGGAVPRLHQRGVELVERAALGVHLGVVLPGLGDHHQHRVRQRAAAHVQQLEHLVEATRSRTRRACRSGRAARGRRGSGRWTSSASRARIQLRLPITVLISPLCAMKRNGWASGQLGNVLVEKRECTTAIAEATRSSTQVGEERGRAGRW